MKTRIVIGADIVPTAGNFDYFKTGNVRALLGNKLGDIFHSADYRILNLEVPLTDKQSPIRKAGPVMRAPASTINGLKAINSDFYCLANNHIMDQGEQGLFSTIKLLKKNKISYAGAGRTLKEAEKPFIADISQLKIGIYCCAEHEYSIAAEKNAGACPYDPLYSFDIVKELRNKCDLLIVLYHGGKEHYRYPTPMLQKVFRKFAETGADVVIAQHTHCIGCIEKYMKSLLVYGQGNFIFDDSDSEFEKTSVILCIDTNGNEHDFTFVPIKKCRNVIRIAEKKEADRIQRELIMRSKEIQTPFFIERSFENLINELQIQYLMGVMGSAGKFKITRIINKLLNYKLADWIYRDNYVFPLDNFIHCETHREILSGITEKKIRMLR